MSRFKSKRLIFFCTISLILYWISHTFFTAMMDSHLVFSPLLFPTLTTFLLIFHLFIASFMMMKYWCDRKRLYLLAIALAFVGSCAMLIGTLNCFPAWITVNHSYSVNYNDAMIFFMMRNAIMAIMLAVATVLFSVRHSPVKRSTHYVIVFGLLLCSAAIISFAWLQSSSSPWLNVKLVDHNSQHFTPLWSQVMNMTLIILWVITLFTMLIVTRLRNIFWISASFLCVSCIITLMTLFSTDSVEGIGWYGSRFFETAATLLIIFTLLYDVFSLYRDSHQKYQQSYQNSIRDPLTRLYNRSYFYETLNHLLTSTTVNKPLSVIVSDLDYFKRINDNYGHLQGDRVLQFVSNLMMDSVRPQDIAARIGGEEFVLLLSNTASEAARQVAERIRQSLSSFDSESSEGQLPEAITISMGVYTATSAFVTAEACVERADKAMYQAKETGRNRVVVSQ